nr:hypothetical protein [Aulosira sp. DedVER01a]
MCIFFRLVKYLEERNLEVIGYWALSIGHWALETILDFGFAILDWIQSKIQNLS